MASQAREGDAAGVATRRAAMRLLEAVLRQGMPLEAALPGATGGIERADDRAFAHAIAAAVLRRLSDLDQLIDETTPRRLPDDAKARFALRIALVQALALATPPHAAIATVLPLLEGGPRRLVHGVFGAVLRSGRTLPERPSLPPAVATRWAGAWGASTVAAARTLVASPPPLDIALRGDATPDGGVSLAPGHLRFPPGTRPPALPGYEAGDFWVQDIAASLPARLFGPGDGRTALDLCAAPGGKAMQLAAAGWQVTAVDSSGQRLARLHENFTRTHLPVEVIEADMLAWAPPAPFDAVLLDAPCSATGIYRRHPDVLFRARPRAIAELADGQRKLLARAAEWVKPGGTLVYAVCSLERGEGEGVAGTFADPRYAPAPVTAEELPEGFAPTPDGHVRVLPGVLLDRGGADGFFVARWRRL